MSQENKLIEAKNGFVSSAVEYAKADIDRRCQKIKIKIKRLEQEIHHIQNNPEESDFLSELISKIKKLEERIDNLRLIKMSLDTIEFNSL